MSSCRVRPAQDVDVRYVSRWAWSVYWLRTAEAGVGLRLELTFFLAMAAPCFGREVGGVHVFRVDVTSLLRTGFSWESNVAATVSPRGQESSRARPARWDSARRQYCSAYLLVYVSSVHESQNTNSVRSIFDLELRTVSLQAPSYALVC